jgi:hypothetical protein
MSVARQKGTISAGYWAPSFLLLKRRNLCTCLITPIPKWYFFRRFGFLDEAALALRIGNQLGREYFEGNLAVELQVDGTVHDTHAATADLRNDSVCNSDNAGRGRPCSCGFRGRRRRMLRLKERRTAWPSIPTAAKDWATTRHQCRHFEQFFQHSRVPDRRSTSCSARLGQL